MKIIPPAAGPVSAWRAAWRKLTTIRTVSRNHWETPLSQSRFVELARSVHGAALASRDIHSQTAAFWKLENLASTFIKACPWEASLRDDRIPLEIRPILHCGMGIGAVEAARFDRGEIERVLDSFSRPEFRPFACESIGAMLAVYEPDPVGLFTQALGSLGLIPLTSLKRPDPICFLEGFSTERRRLMSHGYGRLLYFKQPSFGAALRAIAGRLFLERAPALQGLAFAYAMVNHFDLGRVLLTRQAFSKGADRQAFEDGLTYALVFWEWMVPGFLAGLVPRLREHEDLAERAARQVEAGRPEGRLAAFRVEVA